MTTTSQTTSFAALADKAIAGEALTRGECAAVLGAADADVLGLVAETYRVRRHFCGVKVHLHVLMNAKSGLCHGNDRRTAGTVRSRGSRRRRLRSIRW